MKKLALVYPVVKRNSNYPGYNCFRFDGAKVSATNGVIGITAWLEEGIGLNCNIAATEFYALINSIHGNEVEIIQESNTVQVKAMGIKGKFTVTEYEDIPAIGDCHDVENINVDWIKAMAFCVNGVCKDDAEGMLCGVIADPAAGVFIASDKYRICRAKAECMEALFLLPKSGEPEPFSLPVQFVNILEDNVNDCVKFMISNNGAKFGVLLEGNTVVYTTLLAENYIPLNSFFPKEDMESISLRFNEQFNQAVKRHLDFLTGVNSLDKELMIKIENGMCTLWSENEQLGKVEEEIELKEGVSDLTFGINPMFLKELGAKAQEFKFYPERALLVFNIGGYDYLVNARS